MEWQCLWWDLVSSLLCLNVVGIEGFCLCIDGL